MVEPHEQVDYAAVIDPAKILTLPWDSDGTGLVKCRNWIWDHAAASGAKRHWQLDDNISGFRRLYGPQRIRVTDGTIFRVIEDWTDRYENVPQAGMHYNMFGVRENIYHGQQLPPVVLNTRVYSCHLLSNETEFRFRGIYNDDTDLSLRFLKAGYCTALFLAFLCEKTQTMKLKGGNTPIYQAGDGRDKKYHDGRLAMAQSLYEQHPDVTRITRKWGRWQHCVDYRPFKNNKLVFREGMTIPQGVNNYGMKLVNAANEASDSR